VTDSSLSSHPVYRRLLAGGPEPLRLSLPAAALVIGCGLMLAAVRTIMSVPTGQIAAGLLGLLPATLLTALLIAALSARWLGNRLGALSGLVYLSTLYALQVPPAAAADVLFTGLIAAAMGAFALANVPGRLPLVDRQWPAWVFYAAAGASVWLAGAGGPILIFAAGVLFLLINTDSRGARFLANTYGIALFVLLIAARLAQAACQNDWTNPLCSWHDEFPLRVMPLEVLGALGVAALPWTPLAVLASAVGLRRGHYATPLWRFFGCWILAFLAVASLGVMGIQPPLGAVLPPLAAIGAAGLAGSVLAARRWMGRLRGLCG